LGPIHRIPFGWIELIVISLRADTGVRPYISNRLEFPAAGRDRPKERIKRAIGPACRTRLALMASTGSSFENRRVPGRQGLSPEVVYMRLLCRIDATLPPPAGNGPPANYETFHNSRRLENVPAGRERPKEQIKGRVEPSEL
jgi:hypothetical protein